jgi:hypothetical protein
MRAIQVNQETLPKLAEEIRPSWMRNITDAYTLLSRAKLETYVVITHEVAGGQIALGRVMAGEKFFRSFVLMIRNGRDWRDYPNDWFEVEPIG